MKKIIAVLLVIFLVLLVADFVRFQNAINILKSDMSIKGFDTPIVLPSYRPFLWGRPVSGLTYRSMGNEQIEQPMYVRIRIGEHEGVTIWLNGENWFDYTIPNHNDDENDEKHKNEWYQQEYTSLTGYVKILSHQEYYDKDGNKMSKAKIFYYIETDAQKIYFAIQNITLKIGGCGGGYWYGSLGEPY